MKGYEKNADSYVKHVHIFWATPFFFFFFLLLPSTGLTGKTMLTFFTSYFSLFLSFHFQSHTESCEVCPGITNGTCIVCCSPDVTNLTTSPDADEMTAQVWFDMRSKQRKDDVEYYSEPIRINLLRAPAFTFVDRVNAPACLRVTPHSPLKIKVRDKKDACLLKVKVRDNKDAC